MAPDRQNGTYWLGAFFGAFVMLLTVLAFERITAKPDPSAVLMPTNVIQAYNQGLSDALRTNPPSKELDSVCLDLWTEKQGAKK
jgi:hypothetical protein